MIRADNDGIHQRVVFYKRHFLAQRVAAWARNNGLTVSQRVVLVNFQGKFVYFAVPELMTASNLCAIVGSGFRAGAVERCGRTIKVKDHFRLATLDVEYLTLDKNISGCFS